MDDVEVGQVIKIYSTTNDVYIGKVDSFGPSGLKIILLEGGVPKRISYERISEYDIDVSADSAPAAPAAHTVTVSANGIKAGISRASVFNATKPDISYEHITKVMKDKLEKRDGSDLARIRNIVDYAKKVGEYQKDSSRVLRAIAELKTLASDRPIFKLYIAAIYCDLGEQEKAAALCCECGMYELAFYLYEKAYNAEKALAAAVTAMDATEDEYIIAWICDYAVRANDAQIIKRIVSKNKAFANRALIYWFCTSPLFSGFESLEQANSEENIRKMKSVLDTVSEQTESAISHIITPEKPKSRKSDPKTHTGIISFYNKNGGNGYIKEDGGGKLYFYIKQVKDIELQKLLSVCKDNSPKIHVSYIYGINYTGIVAADRIEMLEAPTEPEAPLSPPTRTGFIFEYDRFSGFGKISSNNTFYNFNSSAIRDPFLFAAIETDMKGAEFDVKFNLKKRTNLGKNKTESVACDIIGVREYSEEEIQEWIRDGVITQKAADEWLNRGAEDTTVVTEPAVYRIAKYEPLAPFDSEAKTSAVSDTSKAKAAENSDREEEICNALIGDIPNPFRSMPKISEEYTSYREQARKYFLVTKASDNERILLEKAESLFIKAIQAGEQLISTIPELVNVYIRLGGYESSYIIKGLQLLQVYGHIVPTESLMHMRIQLIDKGNYKEVLEKILENSIQKCTKKNTKYHYMSMLARLCLVMGKYKRASNLFKACAEFLDKNRAAFAKYSSMIQWPLRSIIIADYYGGDKAGAMKSAEEYLLKYPDDETLRSIADGSIDEAQKDEILENIKDLIYIDSDNTNDSFLVSELVSEYSAYMLDQCEYSQIRDRKYDDETERYIWIPENEEKANGVYDSLSQSSSIFGKDGKLRPGTYEEVADKRLNMAKIAEYCLRNSTELNLTNERITLWKGRFIWAMSQYMWLYHNTYDMKQSSIEDTSSYFLLECISMFFKDSNYTFRYEFFDAINRFLIIQSHVSSAEFRQIEIKPASNLNKKNKGAMVYKEISELESILQDTFGKIIEADRKRAVKLIGMILENCGKEAATYISKLLNPFGQYIKVTLSEELNLPSDRYESTEEWFAIYSQGLHDNYEYFVGALRGIAAAIITPVPDLINMKFALDQAEKVLDNDCSLPISDEDITRCEKLLEQIKAYLTLKNTISINFEVSQERANSLRNEAENLRRVYEENPTRVSHDILTAIMQSVSDEMIRVSDEITQQSLPELTVENEYEEEGYFPQNDKINLMLLISNGKSGKQCTTANNIHMDIDCDDELKKYVLIDQTHFHLLDSLAGGDRSSQQITLHLTSEGQTPDTVFALKTKVTYQTIKGTEECIDVVLNVHIKSADAFVEIPNPYDTKDLKPKGKNAALFKGRSKDVEHVANTLLAGGQGKTVLIYGQYRSGKTSLANFIASEVESRDPSVIIVSGITVMDKDTSHSIVTKITQNICDKLDDLDLLPEYLDDYLELSAKPDNYELFFNKFARELSKLVSAKDIHILLVIDEFGRFFKNETSENFMQLWKSIMELGVFNAILIGHDVVTQMMRADTNSFGVVNTYQINYIDFDSTQQLVTDPTRMKDGRSRFTDNAIQYIWEQSAGNVFYIQHICQATVRFMNDLRVNMVNEVYVRQAIEKWLSKDIQEDTYYHLGHPLFLSGEIGETAATENETIRVLDCITRSNNSATEADIIKMASDDFGLSESVTKNILKSMRARRVIDQDKESERYSIRCRFYPDFLNYYVIKSIQ